MSPWLSQVSPSLSAPVVLFTYFNPIMKRGLANFMRDAKEAGAAGELPSSVTAPAPEPVLGRRAAGLHRRWGGLMISALRIVSLPTSVPSGVRR